METKSKKTLIPVIHPINDEQMKVNIEMLEKLYEQKLLTHIFLINNKCTCDYLIKQVNALRERFKNVWIGVNFLIKDISFVSKYIMPIRNSINAIMVDNANVGPDVLNNFKKHLRDGVKFNGALFGGMFFKQQREHYTKDLSTAFAECSKVLDVVCVSGEKTGEEIDLDKLIEYKKMSSRPLALCSGCNEHNVDTFKNYCDIILVGTGIYSDTINDIIDPKKFLTLKQKFETLST
jgi:hypothetical protein